MLLSKATTFSFKMNLYACSVSLLLLCVPMFMFIVR